MMKSTANQIRTMRASPANNPSIIQSNNFMGLTIKLIDCPAAVVERKVNVHKINNREPHSGWAVRCKRPG